jgi:hypothetical protein
MKGKRGTKPQMILTTDEHRWEKRVFTAENAKNAEKEGVNRE